MTSLRASQSLLPNLSLALNKIHLCMASGYYRYEKWTTHLGRGQGYAVHHCRWWFGTILRLHGTLHAPRFGFCHGREVHNWMLMSCVGTQVVAFNDPSGTCWCLFLLVVSFADPRMVIAVDLPTGRLVRNAWNQNVCNVWGAGFQECWPLLQTVSSKLAVRILPHISGSFGDKLQLLVVLFFFQRDFWAKNAMYLILTSNHQTIHTYLLG